jgi:hypothetical protein
MKPISVFIITSLFTMAALGAESPYAQWKHGLPSDASFFPIAVWLQSPALAPKYKAAGFNIYMALWRGPTEAQLAELKAAGMYLICDQNRVGLAHLDDPTIVGWMQPDEPDNAQEVRDPVTGKRSYGPPTKPQKIVADYERMKERDASRPIYLGLGQGVSNDEWKGRGSAGKPEDYPIYVQGGDIISYDLYPVASLPKPNPEDFLYLVPKGLDRIRAWTGGKKIQWNVIECTHISNPDRQATGHQVKAEVWMSLIHGSTGIVYFVHQFAPKFDEHALLDDPSMLAAVTGINQQIHKLAPVLNSPSVDAVKVKSSDEKTPIDAMVKRHDGATYIFAAGMRNAPAKGTFTVEGLKDGQSIEVIGEDRKLSLHDGVFADDFQPYDVHLYRISP